MFKIGFLLGDILDGLIVAAGLTGDELVLPLAGELDFKGEELLYAVLAGEEVLAGLDSLMGGLGDG
jgi:hypothetical protein